MTEDKISMESPKYDLTAIIALVDRLTRGMSDHCKCTVVRLENYVEQLREADITIKDEISASRGEFRGQLIEVQERSSLLKDQLADVVKTMNENAKSLRTLDIAQLRAHSYLKGAAYVLGIIYFLIKGVSLAWPFLSKLSKGAA